MKKTLVILLAVMVGLAFASGVMAKGAAKTKTLSGEVVSVDASAGTAVVKTKQGDMTFAVGSAKWKNYNSVEDMKPGDKVTVKYVEKDGKMTASWIEKKTMTERMKEKVTGDENK